MIKAWCNPGGGLGGAGWIHAHKESGKAKHEHTYGGWGDWEVTGECDFMYVTFLLGQRFSAEDAYSLG